MGKRNLRKVTLLALFTIFSQFLFPFVSALAENNSILPPSDVTAQTVTPDDVKLTWSSVYGATGYNIYEITEGQLIFHGKTTTNYYNLKDLAEGSYQFVVSTLSSTGESGPSAPVSISIVYPQMVEPGTLTNTIKNGNDIVLNWGASQYAESYNIYEISADNEKSLVASVTNPTYTVSNVAEGQYTYAVSSVNALYGESPLSTPINVEIVHPIMEAPKNFTYTLTNGSDVTLKWASVSFATNYNIYEIKDGEKTLISTVTGTTLKLTNVPAGEYLYEIKSNSDRFGESTEGSQLSVIVSNITMAAPANFKYTLQNVNDIVLSWDSVPYATSYKVYQIIDEEKVLKSTVTGTSVKYSYMPSGDYVYEVHSFSDRYGESAESSKVSVTVETETVAAPQNFDYKIQNGNDIVLSWEGVTNANSYKVYQIENGVKVLKSTVTGTSVTYTNKPEGEYQYEVYAYSTRFGESQEGSQLSFILVHPTMEPPANVVQTINSATQFTLSWDAALYATSYKVYQIIDGNKVLKSTLSGKTVTYSNMAPGEYVYTVHAVSSRFGESTEGKQINVTLDGQIMETPTNLTYTITNGNNITLKWSAVQYANSYNIYQVIDGEKVLIKNLTNTTNTFLNLPAGEYNYVVHSVSSLLGESPEGAEVTISLVHPTMEAPNNLTSSIQNGNDIKLVWESVPFADNYKVYEMIDGQKELVKTVSTLTTTLSNVSEGEHTYVVHSVSNRFGESTEGSKTTQKVVFPTMEAPNNLTTSIQNGNDIKLTWESVPFADNYKVYEIIDGQKELVKTVSTLTTTLSKVSEGKHTYVVHSVSNRFGESTEGSEITQNINFHIMEKPENLTLTVKNGNDIYLKWNTVEFATNYFVYQVIDGEKVLQKTLTGTAVTFTNLPEGDYEYIVHSNSSRYGESLEGSKVSLTLVHPVMEKPSNFTSSITNGNDIVLKWNASTYATAYNVYRISDGKVTLVKTVTSTSTTFTNMPEGDYTYVVHSVSNRFGESPEGSPINFTLTWPIVQSPQVTETVFNANNITLSWPAATWANEYRVYKITNGNRELLYKGTARTYSIYNLTEDTHTFEVTSFNTRFGESEPNQITETIVYPIMESPVATVSLLSETSARISWNFVTYANGYNIYELLDGQPVLVAEKVNNLSYTITNMSYANHEYYVTSYSNSFGESKQSNVVLAKLIVDTEPPVTKIEAPVDWTNEPAVVTLTATDNETGVANTYYSINDSDFVEGTTFSLEEEGVHKVSFYSVDKVGNTEEVKVIEVKIDKTAPATTTEVPTTWSKEAVNVKLNAEDNLSGVATTFYSINGSEYQEGTSFEVTEEGINKITFYSVDRAGNKEELQTVEVKIDKTAPKVSWEIEDEYALNTLLTLNYSSEDNLSGVQSEVLLVNGTQFENGDEYRFDEPGKYSLQLTVVDNAGWITTIEKTITVYIPVNLKVNPQVINQNTGKFTAQVSFSKEFEEEYGKKSIKEFLKGFELKSATLEGVAAINQTKGDEKKAEIGHFKFNREDFNWEDGEIVVEFRGMIGDYLVIGYDTIQVKQDNKKNNKK